MAKITLSQFQWVPTFSYTYLRSLWCIFLHFYYFSLARLDASVKVIFAKYLWLRYEQYTYASLASKNSRKFSNRKKKKMDICCWKMAASGVVLERGRGGGWQYGRRAGSRREFECALGVSYEMTHLREELLRHSSHSFPPSVPRY